MEIIRNAGGKAINITMRKPFDGHQHLRQGAMLKLVGPMVAKRFASAIVMPNTTPPITTRAQVKEYARDIDRATSNTFRPLMTLYLTDFLDPKAVEEMLKLGLVCGIKYYPRGLTTNSDSGVEDPASLWTPGTLPYQCLRVLAEYGGVLLLHAADGFDKNGVELDPYDQEMHFIIETLPRVIDAHPDLKISVEHISTKWGAEFIREHSSPRLGCSVTAQHLLLDRRDMLRGGMRPHTFWWPIIQPQEHKEALLELVKRELPYVWLGSDSAPHPIGKKENACCSGGVLMAHAGIEFYIEAFEEMGALDERFENFASINGPKFYGIEPSIETITLVREDWKIPSMFCLEVSSEPSLKDDFVIPFRAGETAHWKLAE